MTAKVRMVERLLFDIRSNAFPWKIIEPPLIAIAVALTAIALARFDRLKPRALYLGIGYFMLASAPFGALGVSWQWLSLMHARSKDLREERCQTVEGPIENFRPLIPSSYQESFTISNHYFFYSDQNSLIPNPCFHQTSVRNGLLREGLRVRVKYSDNCILQILQVGDTENQNPNSK